MGACCSLGHETSGYEVTQVEIPSRVKYSNEYEGTSPVVFTNTQQHDADSKGSATKIEKTVKEEFSVDKYQGRGSESRQSTTQGFDEVDSKTPVLMEHKTTQTDSNWLEDMIQSRMTQADSSVEGMTKRTRAPPNSLDLQFGSKHTVDSRKGRLFRDKALNTIEETPNIVIDDTDQGMRESHQGVIEKDFIKATSGDMKYRTMHSLPSGWKEETVPTESKNYIDVTSTLPASFKRQVSVRSLQIQGENILHDTIKEKFLYFMSNPSVNAVDTCYRVKRNEIKQLRCIKIWLTKKIDEELLSDNELIPKMMNGCIVDKVEGCGHLMGAEHSWLQHYVNIHKTRTLKGDNPKRRLRSSPQISPHSSPQASPETIRKKTSLLTEMSQNTMENLQGGVSLGRYNFKLTKGTLGYFVMRDDVIGVITAAQIGCARGTKIVSPAWLDDALSLEIGKTEICVLSEEVACCFIRLHVSVPSFQLKDGTVVSGTTKVQIGDKVKYYGSSSDQMVYSEVVQTHWKGTIDSLPWTNQIQLSTPVLPGDSGTLVLKSETNEAVGLLFANAEGKGLANPIDKVLKALDVELV